MNAFATLTVLILLVLIVVLPFQVSLKEILLEFLIWLKTKGIVGVVVFITVYVLVTVLFLPSVILSIGAGFIYGTIFGSIYVEIGATIGACLSFLLAKATFKDFVIKMVENYPMFSAIDKAVSLNSWKIVTLLRLSPLTPYNVLNYALALTRIKFWDYTISSAIGMLPSTILFVNMGTAAKNISDIVNVQGNTEPVSFLTFFTLGITLISVIIVTIISGKAIKEELKEAEAKKTDSDIVFKSIKQMQNSV